MKNILFLLAAILMLHSCKRDTNSTESTNNYKNFDNFITGHSQSPVSRCSDIFINLGFKIPDSIVIRQNLITSQPNLGGNIVINKERNRITLKNPTIKHNVKYHIKFNINQLTKMPRGMENFEFDIEAKRQVWDIRLDAPTSKSMEVVNIKGIIKYADCEPDRTIVEDAFIASQDGEKLPVTWSHPTSNKRVSGFTIRDIKRRDEPGLVDIKLSMSPINVNDEANLKVIIPSKSDFSLHSYRIESNQHVILNFTDPIKKSQDLTGLINVKGRKIKNISVSYNEVNVYFDKVDYGYFDLVILPGIKNLANFPLKDKYTRKLFFSPPKPKVTIAEQGNILPPNGNWEIPVSIVSASGFRLRILKIYEKNAHRFFQENGGSLSNQTGLENIGRIVLDTILKIHKNDYFKETFHSLALGNQIKKEKGALYKLFLTIPFEHNKYTCEKREKSENKDMIDQIDFDRPYITYSYGDDYYYEDNYYYDDNNVGRRRYNDSNNDDRYYYGNPCSSNFENMIQDQRLLVCTDLGLVVKSQPFANKYLAYVSHITNSNPIQGAKVKFYNFQGGLIAQSTSNSSGFATIITKKKPYLAKVNYKGQNTFIALKDANALSMSSFQVEGKKWGGNDKVYFYGERDVWRPGDTVYMNCIIYNRLKKIPQNLPINLTLFDPTNKAVKKWTVKKNFDGLYDCRFYTDINSATGYWRLEMEYGGKMYFKDIRIETIRPNRLKLDIAFENEKMLTAQNTGKSTVQVKWMHGLPAKELQTEVKMLQKSLTNPFGANYKNYVFDDIRVPYEREVGLIADGKTDEEGNLDFQIPIEDKYPSMMLYNFELRAYEKGGAFSTNMKSIKYSPYSSYVGAKFPKGSTAHNIYLKIGDAIQVSCLNQDGKPIDNKVNVSLYWIDYNWWYQFGTKGDYSAINSHILKKISSHNVDIKRAGSPITINTHGRFLVVITDSKSGHSVSRIVYSYEDNYWSEGGDEVAQLEVLPFLIEKDEYNVDDIVEFNLPAIPNGHFVVTVESGGQIVYKEVKKSGNYPVPISFFAESNMSPTAYIHVHFIQAWNKHRNDRPLRLFGVKPIKVFDRNTILNPEIAMPNEIRADKDFDISISEQNGKAISYTLAVVDEGLLDITQFKTPNPWSYFFTKAGLKVKTWDIYRDIFHRFLGEYSSLLAVGGDGVNAINPTAKAQRFKPAVKFLGPFKLSAGEVKTHSLKIKDYVGSVRVMAIATNGKAFGYKEKTVAVKKPLMLYATLPRVLGPGESLKVPVTVFAMDEKVRKVDVSIVGNDKVKVKSNPNQHLSFTKNGEEDIFFDVTVPEKIGIAKVTIYAKSGEFNAKETIELDVRASSPVISKTIENLIPAKEDKTVKFETFGMEGTQYAELTLSRGLNFSFKPFVKKLSNYPHGCIEQTVSSVFPQLYLYKMNILDNESEQMAYRQRFVAIIQRLRYLQVPNGGFSYWPGGNIVHSWGTSYALEFLLEAKKLGYKVPKDMIDKAVNYQYRAADNWRIKSNNSSRYRSNSNLQSQAYCLYTLAKAGKPNYAAINRLRLVPQLPSATKWLLAHALMLVGEKNSADKMLKDATVYVDNYRELSGTFGSKIRDQAMIIRVLLARGEKIKAKSLVDELTPYFKGNDYYLNTQEISQCLISFAMFSSLDKIESSLTYDVSLSEKTKYKDQKISEKPVSYVLDKKGIKNKEIQIKNKGKAELFASILLTGLPARDESGEDNNDLEMQIKYYAEDDNELNPKEITKGTDFVVEYTIIHPGTRMDYENMALSAIFPSGWEIINHRLYDAFDFDSGSDYDYQDIRDDRVYTYFGLNKGTKKTFRFKLNATYEGKYWLPAVYCEAMYDHSIRAKSEGFWVEVK